MIEPVKLAASMLTFNEVHRYLPLCIDHLREFCDEIIVLDDGSNDGTADWLRDHQDDQLKVTFGDHVWHQGKIRQRLLELVHASGATHCLTVDPDEFIAGGTALRAKLEERPELPVWSLDIAEVWDPLPEGLKVRVDGGWRIHPLSVIWTVPKHLGGNWRIMDKALACRRFPIAVGGVRAHPSGHLHLHFGWADKSERQHRFDLYMKRDAGKFHARSHLASIAWPDSRIRFTMVDWPEGEAFDRLRERFGAVTA